MYRAFGYTHAVLVHAGDRFRRTVVPRLRSTLGQGTVEYVALILLVALVMAGVVAALKGYKTDQGKDLGDAIVGKIKDAVDKVKF
jgi:hypothetical protein